MTSEPGHQFEQFRVHHETGDPADHGAYLWTIQMTNGTQMFIRASNVYIEDAGLVVEDSDFDNALLLPPGSWAAAFRTHTPGGPAVALTHILNPTVVTTDDEGQS